MGSRSVPFRPFLSCLLNHTSALEVSHIMGPHRQAKHGHVDFQAPCAIKFAVTAAVCIQSVAEQIDT